MQTERKRSVSNQPEYETLQEVREALLAELEASKQAIEALSEEDLRYVSGSHRVPRQQPPPPQHPQDQNVANLRRMLNQAPPLNGANNRRQSVGDALQQLEQHRQAARQLRTEEENRTHFAELPFFHSDMP